MLDIIEINDLGVKFFYIGKYYPDADTDYKVYFISAPEFGTYLEV